MPMIERRVLINRTILRAGILTVALTLLSGFVGTRASFADPITVTFTASPSPLDPFNAASWSGSFTFDSARVPFRGSVQQVLDGGGLASHILFRWGSTTWTTENAGVWILAVDKTTGLLSAWGLVGPQSGGFITSPAEDVVDRVVMGVDTRGGNPKQSPYFEYTYKGLAARFEGQLEWRQSEPFTPVPEPGTMLLFGSGGLYLIRHLRRSSGRRAQRISGQAT